MIKLFAVSLRRIVFMTPVPVKKVKIACVLLCPPMFMHVLLKVYY